MTRPNGVNTNYTYDNLSRLLSVLHQLSGNTIDGATYTVDAVGNRTAKTNHLNSEVTSYTYDAVYQLTQAVVDSQTTEIYTYDAVGNRLSSLGVSPYSYNSSNQLTSTPSATFTYDDNGNTLSKTEGTDVTDYEWDFENRLVSVTLPDESVMSFDYDPFGRRIRKVATATTIFVYDGPNIIEEVGSSGSVLARYTLGLGIDEPLAMFRDSATHYSQADGLGSITALGNSSGSVAASYTYDSFGNLAASTGSLVNPFRYTARESDPETHLYYYRARYYSQGVGRFLSEDPIGFLGGDSNLYAYVFNSPTNLRDPSGNSATGAGCAVGTLAGPGVGTAAGCGAGTLIDILIVTGVIGGAAALIKEIADRLPEPKAVPFPKEAYRCGKQAKCTPLRYDKQLRGCVYTCDDGTMWFEAAPCKGVLYKPWGTGFPWYPPIPTAP